MTNNFANETPRGVTAPKARRVSATTRSSDTSNSTYPVVERLGKIIADEKWGIVPFALYQYQKQLGLSIADVWFLSWLFMHQWDGRDTYPSLNALSRRADITRQYIQKVAHRLQKRGLITIKERYIGTARASNFYDLSPLREVLEKLITDDPASNYSHEHTIRNA